MCTHLYSCVHCLRSYVWSCTSNFCSVCVSSNVKDSTHTQHYTYKIKYWSMMYKCAPATGPLSKTVLFSYLIMLSHLTFSIFHYLPILDGHLLPSQNNNLSLSNMHRYFTASQRWLVHAIKYFLQNIIYKQIIFIC